MIFFKFLAFILLFLPSGGFASYSFTSHEVLLLNRMFQCLLSDTMSGYVFYDEKPMAIQPYSFVDNMFHHSRYHKISIAIAAAKEIIEKPFFKDKQIIISFDSHDDFLLVIKKELFLQTVQDNLSLFQYVLGPKVEPESLLLAILRDGFFITLNFDSTLIGIVLGYGVQNSLYVAREEEIYASSIMQNDNPPFASLNSSGERENHLILFYPPEDFQENKKWQRYIAQKPSFGFSTLREESEFLSNTIETSSEQLLNNKPEFVFGHVSYDFEALNKIKKLENAQNQIRKDLASSTFINDILSKIAGEKVEISEITENSIPLEAGLDYNNLFAKFLKQSLQDQKYDARYYSSYADGIINSAHREDSSSNYPEGFPSAIANIELAKKNILDSNLFFSELHQKEEFFPILTDYLYYRCLSSGVGDELVDQTRIVVDYEIYDHHGNLLTQSTNSTLNLRETISGFAHGLKGMQIKETREIYIHPAVGYGVYTSLEKGCWLKAVVTLHEIHNGEENFPPLSIHKLKFVLSESFYKEVEKKHNQVLQDHGIRAGNFINCFPQLDREKIVKTFNSDTLERMTTKEVTALIDLFWNNYFANNSS